MTSEIKRGRICNCWVNHTTYHVCTVHRIDRDQERRVMLKAMANAAKYRVRLGRVLEIKAV